MSKKKTARNKATRQHLTTFDEFENNVKTVVEVLQAGIKTIDKWKGYIGKLNRIYLPKEATESVLSILTSFYPFGDLLPKIKRFLTHHIPNFRSEVETRYSNIQKQIDEIVAKCSGYNPLYLSANEARKIYIPYTEMDRLKRDIELFADDLRYCVREAREEIAKEQNNPIWTKPLGIIKWADAFKVSESTVRRWFKDKKYENKKISDRKWSILYKDLPAEVVARVKNQSS